MPSKSQSFSSFSYLFFTTLMPTIFLIWGGISSGQTSLTPLVRVGCSFQTPTTPVHVPVKAPSTCFRLSAELTSLQLDGWCPRHWIIGLLTMPGTKEGWKICIDSKSSAKTLEWKPVEQSGKVSQHSSKAWKLIGVCPLGLSFHSFTHHL